MDHPFPSFLRRASRGVHSLPGTCCFPRKAKTTPLVFFLAIRLRLACPGLRSYLGLHLLRFTQCVSLCRLCSLGKIWKVWLASHPSGLLFSRSGRRHKAYIHGTTNGWQYDVYSEICLLMRWCWWDPAKHWIIEFIELVWRVWGSFSIEDAVRKRSLFWLPQIRI